MDYAIYGKHALIAGGATGIGLAITQAFLAEGSRVTASGLAAAQLDQALYVLGSAAASWPTDTDPVRAYHEQIARGRGITRAEVVSEYFYEIEPTSLICRMIAPREVASSVLHLAASSELNGMAMRCEGGIIRSVV